MSREVSPAVSFYLSQRLREEKKRRRLSQNKLAGKIGIAGGSLANVINRKRGVGDDVLEKIVTFLETTREDLDLAAELAYADARSVPAARTAATDALGWASKIAQDIADDGVFGYAEALVATVAMAGPIDDGVAWRRSAITRLQAQFPTRSALARPTKARSRSSRAPDLEHPVDGLQQGHEDASSGHSGRGHTGK